MRLCGHQSFLAGAEPCPREAGHSGRHFWWTPFEHAGCWRVIVYAGDWHDRRRLAMGAFTAEPTSKDVHDLLIALVHARRRQERLIAKRSRAGARS